MKHSSFCAWMAVLVMAAGARAQQSEAGSLQKIPAMQVIPLPLEEVSFQRNEKELMRLYAGPDQQRPFLYPITGPSGRSLTRMGHPHDPFTHSHHNSVWISHQDVAGVNFWTDHGAAVGVIVPQRVVRLEDGPAEAAVLMVNHWQNAEGVALLLERRRMAAVDLNGSEWLLLIDLEFEPAKGQTEITIGQNPFGLVGVRMAKWIGVKDGGGAVRNSAGQQGEQGDNGVFRKPARWVDYSGRVAEGVVEGLTLMDHSGNVNHPAPFHVRGDGWMGACLTLDKPVRIEKDKPLRLRYGLWVHAGMPEPDRIEQQWKHFSQLPPADLNEKRR